MANFLLTFHGGSMPETKEQQDQVMKAWTAWFGTLGDALIDGGNPISQAKATSPDRSVMDAKEAPSGYSIIKADNLNSAVALAKGCPVSGWRRRGRRVGDVPRHVVVPGRHAGRVGHHPMPGAARWAHRCLGATIRWPIR